MYRYTLIQCQTSDEVRDIKIKTLEYAITQTEAIIRESKMDQQSLIFLRDKLARSVQDLEILYLLKTESHDEGGGVDSI